MKFEGRRHLVLSCLLGNSPYDAEPPPIGVELTTVVVESHVYTHT